MKFSHDILGAEGISYQIFKPRVSETIFQMTSSYRVEGVLLLGEKENISSKGRNIFENVLEQFYLGNFSLLFLKWKAS